MTLARGPPAERGEPSAASAAGDVLRGTLNAGTLRDGWVRAGAALVAVERYGRVEWLLVPRYAETVGIVDPLRVGARIVGLPVTLALDLATLPLQPLFLPASGSMLLFLLGPV